MSITNNKAYLQEYVLTELDKKPELSEYLDVTGDGIVDTTDIDLLIDSSPEYFADNTNPFAFSALYLTTKEFQESEAGQKIRANANAAYAETAPKKWVQVGSVLEHIAKTAGVETDADSHIGLSNIEDNKLKGLVALFDKDGNGIIEESDINTFLDPNNPRGGLGKDKLKDFHKFDSLYELKKFQDDENNKQINLILEKLNANELTPEELKFFDVNGDGQITKEDITLLLDQDRDGHISDLEFNKFNNKEISDLINNPDLKRYRDGLAQLYFIEDTIKADGTTDEELEFFDVNGDNQLTLEDIKLLIDIDKNSVVSKEEFSIFDSIDTVSERQSEAQNVGKIIRDNVAAENGVTPS